MIKTTVTSWSFPQLTLKEVVGLAKALNLGGVDLSYFYKSGLDKNKLLENPTGYAETLKPLKQEFPCLYHLFGDDLYAGNVADVSCKKDNVAQMSTIVEFCNAANIGQIMLLPGMINNGQTRLQAFECAVESLNAIVPVARDKDVLISVEPHVHGLLESPTMARQLVDAVPGLGLTLDYAHLVCLGYTQEEIDPLISAATHVHFRQARAGVLQEKLQHGTINFQALLAELKQASYQGYVAYEYVHQEYMSTLSDDVLTETVLMRNLVQEFLSAPEPN